MKYLLQEKIFRRQIFPPDFFTYRRTGSGTAASWSFEYAIPDDNDFFLQCALSHGHATGGETVSSNIISIRRFDAPSTEYAILAMEELSAPGSLSILRAPEGIYLPRKSIIRADIVFSAAVQSKTVEFNILGWNAPAYDVEFYP